MCVLLVFITSMSSLAAINYKMGSEAPATQRFAATQAFWILGLLNNFLWATWKQKNGTSWFDLMVVG